MRKFTYLFLSMFVAGALFMTGCNNDDESTPAPNISIGGVTGSNSSEQGVHQTGEQITFTISAKAEGKIDKIIIDQTVDQQTTNLNTIDGNSNFSNSNTEFSGTHTIDSLAVDSGKTVTIKVEVQDKEDNSAQDTYTIEVGTELGQEITNGVFYHYYSDQQNGAYSLTQDQNVSAQNSPESDQEMQSNDDNDAQFTGSWVAPAENGTKFVKDNSYNYDLATVANASQAYNNGTPDSTVTQPSSGDIYIANIKDNNQFAVIQVTNIDPDAAQDSDDDDDFGKLEFKYKKK